MDYYRLGDLLDIMGSSRLPEMEVIEISKKLIDALCYLHARGIAHRDIKPENIVLDTTRNPVLIDFGLCTDQISCLSATMCGTMFYIPPEELQNHKYDAKKADVWSLGITIYVIATGTFPFTSENPKNMLKEMENMDFILKKSVNHKIYRFLSQMLVVDPEERKSAEEIKNSFSKQTNQFLISCANTKPNKLKYFKQSILPASCDRLHMRDTPFFVRIAKPQVLSRGSLFNSVEPIRVF